MYQYQILKLSAIIIHRSKPTPLCSLANVRMVQALKNINVNFRYTGILVNRTGLYGRPKYTSIHQIVDERYSACQMAVGEIKIEKDGQL